MCKDLSFIFGTIEQFWTALYTLDQGKFQLFAVSFFSMAEVAHTEVKFNELIYHYDIYAKLNFWYNRAIFGPWK